MAFIVVFVLRSGAGDEPEGSICGEDDIGVVDGAEVGELCGLEVVIGEDVEGISSDVGLPLLGDLIETFCGEIGLNGVVGS